MFTVINKKNNSINELETIEELIYELEILNKRDKVIKKNENLIIHETNDKGDIIDTFTVTLPTDKEIEDILTADIEDEYEEYENDEYDKNEEYSEKTTLRNIKKEDLPEEERKVFENLGIGEENFEEQEASYKKRQREIRKQVSKAQEENQEVEYKEKSSKHDVINNKEEYGYYKAMEKRDKNNTTLYEFATIVPIDDLKNEFKQRLLGEVLKIEQQIYLLEKQAKDYRKLIMAMEEIG